MGLAAGHEDVKQFVADLLQRPDREPIASEIEGGATTMNSTVKLTKSTVLQSIYGDDAIQLWIPNPQSASSSHDLTITRYEAVLR